jgi:hypothetical protein
MSNILSLRLYKLCIFFGRNCNCVEELQFGGSNSFSSIIFYYFDNYIPGSPFKCSVYTLIIQCSILLYYSFSIIRSIPENQEEFVKYKHERVYVYKMLYF